MAEGGGEDKASARPPAVFISYASQDAEAAQKICEALRAAGIEGFLDQSELRGGDAWDQKIRHEIHDCALFIPIVSQHTQERLEGYFRRDKSSHTVMQSRPRSRRSRAKNFRCKRKFDLARRAGELPDGCLERRRGRRRVAVLGGLFVTVADLYQHVLGPRSAEEFDAHRDAERGRLGCRGKSAGDDDGRKVCH
jgi:hypothetical protein